MLVFKIAAWVLGGGLGLIALFIVAMYVLLITDRPGTDS